MHRQNLPCVSRPFVLNKTKFEILFRSLLDSYQTLQFISFKLHSMKSWRKLDQRQVSLWDLIFEYHCFQGKWLIRWLSNNAQLPLTCCWLQFHEQINHNQRVSQNTLYPFIHISTQELDQSLMDAYFFSWLKNNTTIFIESHEYPFIHLFT